MLRNQHVICAGHRRQVHHRLRPVGIHISVLWLERPHRHQCTTCAAAMLAFCAIPSCSLEQQTDILDHQALLGRNMLLLWLRARYKLIDDLQQQIKLLRGHTVIKGW